MFIFTKMSIHVCARMDDWRVVLFTLTVPLIIVALSHILKVDSDLRKEMELLETHDLKY